MLWSGGEEVLAYFREFKVPCLDVSSVNEKFSSTVACVADACGQPSIGLLPSGAGMLRARTMGASKVCLVAAHAWDEVLKRQGSEKAVTLTEAMQQFRLLESAPTDANRVSAAVVPANALLWVPTGWCMAECMMQESGPLWCGVRQSFFGTSDNGKKNLQSIRAWASAEAAPAVAALDAVIKLYE
eukprot:6458087-Amphidinium_carterae.2